MNDTGGVLNDLLVTVLVGDGEWLNNSLYAHIFKSSTALLINTEVANREESDSPYCNVQCSVYPSTPAVPSAKALAWHGPHGHGTHPSGFSLPARN